MIEHHGTRMNVIVGRANIVKTIEDTEAPASPVIFNSDYEEAEGIGAGHFVSFFLREVFPSSLLPSGQHRECPSLEVAMISRLLHHARSSRSTARADGPGARPEEPDPGCTPGSAQLTASGSAVVGVGDEGPHLASFEEVGAGNLPCEFGTASQKPDRLNRQSPDRRELVARQ